MLDDYCARLYAPAARSSGHFSAKAYAAARDLAAWKQRVAAHWPSVAAAAQGPHESQYTIGETAPVSAQVLLGELTPDEVRVEIVYGDDQGAGISGPKSSAMTLTHTDAEGVHHYAGTFAPEHTGALIYGVRVLPHHPDLLNKHDLALVVWAN
jgi:starch phosphorylase